jgi:xylitol oxidase
VSAPGSNWAGTYAYGARELHRPSTLEQLQELVARTPRLRVLGSRHSFSDLPDSAELVSLEDLPAGIAVAGGTVSCGGGVRYGELAEALNAEGVALHNLASLPHISVAGAVATATHGSGDASGNLATAVAGLELVTSSGELVTAARGDEHFDGLVVGLGALGVVTRLVLDVEPEYEIAQRVYEGLSWEVLFEHFDAIMASGDSVSVFTVWDDVAGRIWVKARAAPPADELFGAVAATGERHPIPGLDPIHCTRQQGVPGRWSDRLPHFQAGFVPSVGEEIQSEYLVPRAHALAAIEAVRAIGDALRPALQVCEIRTIAADTLWLSPQYGQDTIGFHFTWKREPELVGRLAGALEVALAPFAPRPHWGKLFLAGAATIADRYERLPDFERLADRLDPRGAFRNAWLERHLSLELRH